MDHTAANYSDPNGPTQTSPPRRPAANHTTALTKDARPVSPHLGVEKARSAHPNPAPPVATAGEPGVLAVDTDAGDGAGGAGAGAGAGANAGGVGA